MTTKFFPENEPLMMNWEPIEQAISDAENTRFQVEKSQPVSGGSINSAYLIEGCKQQYFVKTNTAKNIDMFAAEIEGLHTLSAAKAIKVPQPICCGAQGSISFIVLEYVSLTHGNQSSAEDFGQQLAALHKVTNSQFGWHRSNTIGSTEQMNKPSKNWLDFYRQNRLVFQITLAIKQGHSGQLQKLGGKICDNLASFFETYDPQPSLLHGDLWSGNYAYDIAGRPVIFDPAVYYGDRETDLAMTELFGGFPADFYRAYHAAYPLDDGYSVRKNLYKLYHVLNHLNLFGGSYYAQSISLMQCLLAEI